MITTDLAKLGQLSPFELKNRLVARAASHADRVMLNAGRGNPNFLATEPRHGFFQLGQFAMAEAEKCADALPEGVAGLPALDGIAARFEDFLRTQRDAPGVAFLTAALFYARERLGLSRDAFVHELALFAYHGGRERFMMSCPVERRPSDMPDPAKLPELAAWYREFAERTGSPMIWLRTAEDLDAEADRLERLGVGARAAFAAAGE